MDDATMEAASQPAHVGLEKLLIEIQELLVVVDEDKHDATIDAYTDSTGDAVTRGAEAEALPEGVSVESLTTWMRANGCTAAVPEGTSGDALFDKKLAAAIKLLGRKALLWDKVQDKLLQVLNDCKTLLEDVDAKLLAPEAAVKSTAEFATQTEQEAKESATQTDVENTEIAEQAVDIADAASEEDTQVEEGEIRSEAMTPTDRMSPNILADVGADAATELEPPISTVQSSRVQVAHPTQDVATATDTHIAEPRQIPQKEATLLLAKLKKALKAETLCFSRRELTSKPQASISALPAQPVAVPHLVLPLSNGVAPVSTSIIPARPAGNPLLQSFSSTRPAEPTASRPVDPRLARQQAKKAAQERQKLDSFNTVHLSSASPNPGDGGAAFSSTEPASHASQPQASQPSRPTYAAATAAQKITRQSSAPTAVVQEEVYVTTSTQPRARPGILDLVPDYLRGRKLPMQPSAAVDLQASTQDVIAAVDSARASSSPKRSSDGNVPSLPTSFDVTDFESPAEINDYPPDDSVDMDLSDGDEGPAEPPATDQYSELDYLFDDSQASPRTTHAKPAVSAVSTAGLKAMFVGRKKTAIPPVQKVARVTASTQPIKLVAKQPKEIDRERAAEFAREAEEAERLKYSINPAKAAAPLEDDDQEIDNADEEDHEGVHDDTAVPLEDTGVDDAFDTPIDASTDDQPVVEQTLTVTYEDLLDSDSESPNTSTTAESVPRDDISVARTSKKRSRSPETAEVPRKRQAREASVKREVYLTPSEAKLAKGKLVPVVLVPYKRVSGRHISATHPAPVQQSQSKVHHDLQHPPPAKTKADGTMLPDAQSGHIQVGSEHLPSSAPVTNHSSVSILPPASQQMQQTSSNESIVIEILDSDDDMPLDEPSAIVEVARPPAMPLASVAEVILSPTASIDASKAATANEPIVNNESAAVMPEAANDVGDAVGADGDVVLHNDNTDANASDVVDDSDDAIRGVELDAVSMATVPTSLTSPEPDAPDSDLPQFGGLSQATPSVFTPGDSEFDELYDEGEEEPAEAVPLQVNGIGLEVTAGDDASPDPEGSASATPSRKLGRGLSGIYSRIFG